jgi:glycosyltransferase involved in cell wall biosynthesis
MQYVLNSKTRVTGALRLGEGGGGGTPMARPAHTDTNRPRPSPAMRVLLAVGRGKIAGTERHVLELARALDVQGAEVTVLVFSEGPLVGKLRSLGIDVHVLTRRSRFDLLLLWRLVRFFRRRSFDVVHAHPERIVCLAARLAGVPAVLMTFHSFGRLYAREVRAGRLLILVEKLRASVVDFTIAISPAGRDILIHEFGRKPDKIGLILNGIAVTEIPEVDRAAVLNEFGISTNACVISTVARLSREKGIEFLVRSMTEVVGGVSRAVLLVIGEGELATELKNLSLRLELGSHVMFLGYRDDAQRLIAASDLVVLSSSWEGTPYALLEAMLASKPIVATNACAHVVLDGETGVLVSPSDSRGTAEAILKILGDTQIAHRMGRLGRERLEQHFSADIMAGETMSVYREILMKKSRSVR